MDHTEFKEKLERFYNERGLTTKLRTYLRQLILNELQCNPVSKCSPRVTLRARAMGSLLVEWLQKYECYYTISVLASELPSLADLPGIAGEGERRKLEKEEVDEILVALEIDSKELEQEYECSSDSLLSSIIKEASKWKARLEFRELPVCVGDAESWSSRLQDILAKAAVSPDQLNSLYLSVHSLIKNEVTNGIAEERMRLLREFTKREENFSKELHWQEQNLLVRIFEAEEGLKATKEKVFEELNEKKLLLEKLKDEVQSQHEMVVEGLAALEVKQRELEASQNAWKNNVNSEMLRQKNTSVDLSNRKKNLDLQEEQLKLKELEFKKKVNAVSLTNQGASTTLENKTVDKKIRLTGQVGESSLAALNTPEQTYSSFQGNNMQGNSRQNASQAQRRLQSPPEFPTISETSSEPSCGAWHRLKELREETKRGKEDFMEYLRAKAFSGSSSESDEDDMQTSIADLLRGRTALQRSQITFPHLHEGYDEPHYPSSSVRASKRYSYLLLSQESQPEARRSFSRVPLTEASYSRQNARLKLKEESKKLENLIQVTRQNSHLEQRNLNLNEIKEKRENRKLDVLLNSFRSASTKKIEELVEKKDLITIESGKSREETRLAVDVLDGKNELMISDMTGLEESLKLRNKTEFEENLTMGALPALPKINEILDLRVNLPLKENGQRNKASIDLTPPSLERLPNKETNSEKKNSLPFSKTDQQSPSSRDHTSSQRSRHSSPHPLSEYPDENRTTKESDHPRTSLIQAALIMSDVSEGEIVSAGKHSSSSDDFWA